MNAFKAGIAYFAIIFALGFVLGTARVLFIIPRIGELPATLLEMPVILTASWFVCGWLIKRFEIAPANNDRLGMGAAAFSLLVIAEPALGLVFGKSLATQWADLLRPAGIVGLSGQILFALIPWIRLQAGNSVRDI